VRERERERERRDDADESKTADELYVPWTGGVDWLEGVKR